MCDKINFRQYWLCFREEQQLRAALADKDAEIALLREACDLAWSALDDVCGSDGMNKALIENMTKQEQNRVYAAVEALVKLPGKAEGQP